MAENKKTWFDCPKCRKHLVKYDELKAKSAQVYIKCKNCKEEVEIKIN